MKYDKTYFTVAVFSGVCTISFALYDSWMMSLIMLYFTHFCLIEAEEVYDLEASLRVGNETVWGVATRDIKEGELLSTGDVIQHANIDLGSSERTAVWKGGPDYPDGPEFEGWDKRTDIDSSVTEDINTLTTSCFTGKEDSCPKCGWSLRVFAGCSAHPDNWYCSNPKCDWEARNDRMPKVEDNELGGF